MLAWKGSQSSLGHRASGTWKLWGKMEGHVWVVGSRQRVERAP